MENESMVNENVVTPVEDEIVFNEETIQANNDLPKKNIFQKMANWKYSHLFLCFSIPFLLMFLVYAVIGIHPFGNNSVLTLDLQAQFVYYYEEVRRLMVEGGSWLYSWGRTLGGEMMGMIDYYMCSPFNVILVLFPKEKICDAIMLIQLAKVGSMGLTFGIYLELSRRTKGVRSVMFSLMYALCAFSVIQLINPMWLDAVILLPLLVLGTELLIREKKILLYVTSLSLIFITNYYMGYMCGIFTAIYFVYYYILVRPDLLKKPQLYDKLDPPAKRFLRSYGLRTFVRFALCTLFAIGVAAFSLYSAYYSLQFGKSTFANSPSFALKLNFDLLDFFVKLLPGSYDSVRPTGLPMIYCGLLALISLPLFYTSKHITTRHKAAATFVLVVLFFSMILNPVDLAWHGFSSPNWLNHRYSYVFSFFLVVLAADTFNGLKKIKRSYIGITISVLIAMVVIIGKLDIVFPQDSKSNPLDDAGCILLTVALAIVYLAVFMFIKKNGFKKTALVALACVVGFEMFASALLTVIEVQTDVGVTPYNNTTSSSGATETYTSYNGSIIRIKGVVDEVLDSDKTFYRMESTVYRKLGGVNEPYAFGYYGISHSTSTLNAKVIQMLETLGYSSRSHWSKYIGGTPVSDALLGIKYVITVDDTLDENIFSIYKQGEQGYQIVKTNSTVYALMNNKALSIAYGVSDNVIDDLRNSIYSSEYLTALQYQNMIIDSMLKKTSYSGTIFKGIAAGIDTENCEKNTFVQNHTYVDENGETVKNPTSYYSFTKGVNGKVIFDFTSPVDGPIYYHFPAANFGKIAKVYVNGSYLTGYFENETSCILKLGNFRKGQSVSVELRMDDPELYISKESKYFFYYIDYSALSEAFSYLQDGQMEVEEYGNDYLKGSIYLPTGQTTIFTTIPYDKGWNIYVDGEKVEYEMVMDSLIAIPSTEGYHELEFRYMPKGYLISIVVEVICAFVLLLLWLITYLKPLREFVLTKILKKEYSEASKVGDLSPLNEYPYFENCEDLSDEQNEKPNEVVEEEKTDPDEMNEFEIEIYEEESGIEKTEEDKE